MDVVADAVRLMYNGFRSLVKSFFFQYNNGKIAVLGSVHIFCDQYVEKEENNKILDVLISFLTTDNMKLNQIDAEDPEVSILEASVKSFNWY